MGLFDYVSGVDLKCPKGHQLSEFQTKDFDCVLDTIVFADGKLVSAGSLCLTECACGHGFSNIPHLVNLYTHCRHPDCMPSEPHSWGLWCEFDLHLARDGTIVETTRIE